MRFDVPVIGVATIEAMARAGATCLAIEAGSTLFFDAAALPQPQTGPALPSSPNESHDITVTSQPRERRTINLSDAPAQVAPIATNQTQHLKEKTMVRKGVWIAVMLSPVS